MTRTNGILLGLLVLLGAVTGCADGRAEDLPIAGLETPPEVKLFPIEVDNGRWGFMNNSGKLVIEARFRSAKPFQAGYSVVANKEYKHGLIDGEGRYVIEPKYDFMSGLSDGLVRVTEGGNNKIFYWGHYGFVDLSGKVVVKPELGFAWDFRDGLAAAMERGWGIRDLRTIKVGFIDRKGRWVVRPQYGMVVGPMQPYGFSEGLAVVKTDKGFGYIDRTGRMVIEPKFGIAGHFSEGLAQAKLTDMSTGKNDLGYINKQGEFVIKPQFATGLHFSEGLAAAARDDSDYGEKPTWGYINKSGEWVIKPRFYGGEPFDHGWAKVQTRKSEPAVYDLYDFIDRTGKEIRGNGHTYEGPLRHGIAPVKMKVRMVGGYSLDRVGYVDRVGNFVWEPRMPEAREITFINRLVDKTPEWRQARDFTDKWLVWYLERCRKHKSQRVRDYASGVLGQYRAGKGWARWREPTPVPPENSVRAKPE